MSGSTVVKASPTAADAYPAEAAGLEWLAGARGARIVSVIAVSSDRIELERIDPVAPDAASASAFGEALSVTHSAGAEAFGNPPAGWTGRLYIGRREMPAAHEDSWGRFYARDRVLPFLAVAERVGSVTSAEAVVVRNACAAVSAGVFDDDDPPVRLHGDLWSGNLLWGSSGAVLIDPAAHGGHRETDLAMLDLFGCPHLDDVRRGYASTGRLRSGWRERIPLHQLHPLAVHAAGHGRAYGAALARAAASVLALAS